MYYNKPDSVSYLKAPFVKLNIDTVPGRSKAN